jgi:hypothetical protein
MLRASNTSAGCWKESVAVIVQVGDRAAFNLYPSQRKALAWISGARSCTRKGEGANWLFKDGFEPRLQLGLVHGDEPA